MQNFIYDNKKDYASPKTAVFPLKITAIITAAGSGTRAGLGKNKVLTEMPAEFFQREPNVLAERRDKSLKTLTVLESAAKPFDDDERITEIIFTASKQDFCEIEEIAKKQKTPFKVVLGGSTRSLSVMAALGAASGDVVLIHDGARPFITGEIISACISGVLSYGSAVTAVPCVNSVAEIDENGNIIKCSRARKCEVQTPQAFFTEDILRAYDLAAKNGEVETFTDESGVYSRYIRPAHVVEGDIKNKKLTYPEDFLPADELRAGTGFDLHRLVEGRKLILGGVEIPHDKGLLGHSDADVLTHAVMDALLSAAALRDIGYYFSDKDEKYKDICSLILLKEVLKMLEAEGFEPNNVSAVIQAQKPKLSPHINDIRAKLASELNLPLSAVGVGCTTLEGIGIVGREEGIAATAYCTIKRKRS